MKKHDNVYPLIFGIIMVLVGILTYFTNGAINIPFIVIGLIFIGVFVSLFFNGKNKKDDKIEINNNAESINVNTHIETPKPEINRNTIISQNNASKAVLYDNRTIYSYGAHIPGLLHEEVKLKYENGVYYYITLSMTDRMNAGGHKLPVPPIFINNNDIDIDGLLVYIAQHHNYMETMIKYLSRKKTINSIKDSFKVIAKIDGFGDFVESGHQVKLLISYMEKAVSGAEKLGYVVKVVKVSGGVHKTDTGYESFADKTYVSFTDAKEKLPGVFTEYENNADGSLYSMFNFKSLVIELSRNGYPFFIVFEKGEIYATNKPYVTEALGDVFKDLTISLDLENQELPENRQKNKKYNLCPSIDLMTEFLKKKNYEIEHNSNEMSVVQYSDDSWNHFNKIIARKDGIYNFIERNMGGYELTKRLSCDNLETSSFVLLAYFCAIEISKEKSISVDGKKVSKEIKQYVGVILEKVSDYNYGQWIIDEIRKVFSYKTINRN